MELFHSCFAVVLYYVCVCVCTGKHTEDICAVRAGGGGCGRLGSLLCLLHTTEPHVQLLDTCLVSVCVL